jgi:DNA gyrase subunit A
MADKDEKDNDGSASKSTPGETISSVGYIQPRPIVTEMEESYLTYAMSVIMARALPDARDGLKPVHRRVLVTLNDLGLRPGGRFRKCAKICGDVSGNYHPHGEAIVYPSLARLAQDFSMRYPLVIGQGNFGSIDGDAPAAMRYTEAKMSTRKEPSVLPSMLPNLLANGTVGIAVGMATNIPPHNLSELLDASMHLVDTPDATNDDLLKFVKGPDFPTGGIVYDKKAIHQAYQTGRGSVIVRGKAEIEEVKGGRYQIRISDIPYQVNKSTMIEKMAYLVQEKIIQGISDIRDESDQEGIRVIIELKKDSYPQKILNQLYKHTDLQSSFGYNMIALADGLQPRLMDLQELLQIFIDHRRVVIVRRITFDRNRAKERAHILEGLKKALDHIDKIITLIKKSATKEEAHTNLVRTFKLSVIQADAILQMRLQTLAGLERKKVEDELKEKKRFIEECEAILRSTKKIDELLKKEMINLKEIYGDKRRTTVVAAAAGEFTAKDTIPNAPMIVTLTQAGYVKRLSPMQFRAQARGGKGVKGMETREDDEVLSMLHVMNHDDLLFFTNTGRVFRLPTYELPQGTRIAKGQAIVNLLQLQPDERISAILKADLTDKTHLFMVSKYGVVKRTTLDEFENIRRSGLIAQKMRQGDELRWVVATSGKDHIVILSRIEEGDVRAMGRSAAGVRGLRLGSGDYVVETGAVDDPTKSRLLVVMENGLGKMTAIDQYRLQGRGGSGVKAAHLTAKTGDIIGGCVLTKGQDGDLVCISRKGQTIRMRLVDIPCRGRATQGVLIMRMKARDTVASMSTVMEDKEAQQEVQQAAAEEREVEVEEVKERVMKEKRIGKRQQRTPQIGGKTVSQ